MQRQWIIGTATKVSGCSNGQIFLWHGHRGTRKNTSPLLGGGEILRRRCWAVFSFSSKWTSGSLQVLEGKVPGAAGKPAGTISWENWERIQEKHWQKKKKTPGILSFRIWGACTGLAVPYGQILKEAKDSSLLLGWFSSIPCSVGPVNKMASILLCWVYFISDSLRRGKKQNIATSHKKANITR